MYICVYMYICVQYIIYKCSKIKIRIFEALIMSVPIKCSKAYTKTKRKRVLFFQLQ